MKKYTITALAVLLGMSNFETATANSSEKNSWQLIWSDEFNEEKLDTTKWTIENNCYGGGNHELQCYTSQAKNIFTKDGSLHIAAVKEPFDGQKNFDDQIEYKIEDKSKHQEYTSGRIRTRNKADWKYGRFEIRAIAPQGQGIWPGIWMMPTEDKYGPWPLSGEIDIMEAINTNTFFDKNKVYGTLHYGNRAPNNLHTGTHMSPKTPIWNEYHTYAVEWEAGEIRWYVDDVHYETQRSSGWFTGASKEKFAPFDQKFHIILNLAVGGDWPGSPNQKTVFPQELKIDFVRVYRCDVEPETGKGCATDVNRKVIPLKGNKNPNRSK